MLRVRLDRLQTTADGRLAYQEELFSGVAYRVEGVLVVANYTVSEGVLGAPYEDWDDDVLRITLEALLLIDPGEESKRYPEPGFYYGRSRFEGVVYYFEQSETKGALLSETEYDATGPIIAGYDWYPSGQLRVDHGRIRADGRMESETWHENGQRASLDVDGFAVAYTEAGRLRVLGLESGYPVEELERVSFHVDQRLYLGGPEIDDKVAERLEGLADVNNLFLSATQITRQGLQLFQACTALADFATSGNTHFTRDDVRELLAPFPECTWLDRDQE